MSLLKLKSKFCKLNPNNRLYGLDIPIIGLTGGIATGKSSASSILEKEGAPIIDADALVKDIYSMDETIELLSKLVPQVLKDKKAIDFKLLREIFFNNHRLKGELETHIYSLLPQAFRARLESLEAPNFVIYDVPLLFEKGLQKSMDLNLLIYAPRSVQLERLTSRDQIEPKLANQILDSQMSIEEKKDIADETIENVRDLEHLNSEISKFLQCKFSRL